MKTTRIATILAAALSLGAAAFAPASSLAAFGIEPGSFDGIALDQNGHAFTRAGGHPYNYINGFSLNSVPDPKEKNLPKSDESNLRNATVELPPGFVGNPRATPKCSLADFALEPGLCPDNSQVGVAHVFLNLNGQHFDAPAAIYNLTPPVGVPAEFGWYNTTVPTTMTPSIRSDGDYGLNANFNNIDETLDFTTSRLEFWGSPASPSHDMERGDLILHTCNDTGLPAPCPSTSSSDMPFLTNQVDCAHGPFTITAHIEAWAGQRDSSSFVTHDEHGNPVGVTDCDRVPFEPSISSSPTTDNAGTPSGLDFEMEIPDAGIENPDGIAQANLKKAVVTLPEGMTLNPSAAEGLGVCARADFARETIESTPGSGCPNASKIGAVAIRSPLLESGEDLEGSLYIAKPYENPFGTLLAVYLVAKLPQRGVIIKVAGRVDPDLHTGQIKTTFENLPQLPFSTFKLHFREGGRAPLVSAPNCGEKVTEALLTPWSATSPEDVAWVTSTSLITHGVSGGPCPSGGVPPFQPGLIAGTLNNAAGSYSPFNVRLFRTDEEQEITHFSIKLPPGVIGKLAGLTFCPDAAIEAAKRRTGTEEQQNPSCPASSEIGRTLVGTGVGSVLTYVPGKVYLAGPYNGSTLSIAAITAAKVGPFDVGTVVVRDALKVNPETAEVFIDATGSDPIPHIIDGITTHLRDIRVYTDRPQFTLNPTSCKRTSTASTLLGSGLDFASEADDQPVTVTSPFQAADCAGLGFKPKLALFVKGGTRRGATPKFRAVLTARKGDANIGAAQVTLPHSEFLEQAHIKTICTRVLFNLGTVPGEKCPAGSVYGFARAITPILDEPLEGPVFLRSSSHNLPDLVASLHSGKINIVLNGRIDSVKDGRIRNTFEAVPDAPVTKFTLEMQGGKKGLLVNSTNLCKSASRAIANFTGQNGKVHSFRPIVKAGCGARAKRKSASAPRHAGKT